MSDDRIFSAWVNPLQFLEVDEPWASMTEPPPTLEDVVRFLCTPGVECDLNSLVARYKEISNEERRLFAAPAEVRILEKLVWPLRHAKAAYMVGNYLGTISLCGMVAEMVAILLFELSEFHINNKLVDDKKQKELFGSTFEGLGQDRRVKVLKSINIIDEKTESAFDSLRLIRKRYLHLWSQDHEKLPKDAITAYNNAIHLVVQTIGQDIQDGKIILNPALVKYLQRKGVFKENEDNFDTKGQSTEEDSKS